MDETIRRYANLVTVPGEKYEYSNLGYGILGHVISRVSGKSYDDFMRQAVFSKLGLTHTAVGIPKGYEKNAAVRYGPDGAPIPFYDFDHRGASAIYSSAHDLVRFGMFHLKAHLPDQKQVLNDASIEQMQTATMAITSNSGYGIGWRVDNGPAGMRQVSHTGGMGGVATVLTLIPARKVAVVVLCNANGELPYRVSSKLIEVLVPELKPEPAVPIPPPPPTSLPAELIGTWTGVLSTYKADLPLRIHIRDAANVEAQLAGQPQTAMTVVRWDGSTLHARLLADIGTEDAGRRPYKLFFHLKLRGQILSGPASAISEPGKRAGNALTQWVEVRK
jgi:CubicO group peptidase (beta-lactamase class C family)